MNRASEPILIRDWLVTRAPPPPAQLSAKLASIIGDETCNLQDLPSRLISAAERILTQLGADRAAATDLLAADALITYAIEAAAENCSDLDILAADAAIRISRLAPDSEHGSRPAVDVHSGMSDGSQPGVVSPESGVRK